MAKQSEVCYACGDPATKQYKKQPVCQECWDELANGKINCESVHPYGVGGSYGPLDDDGGPWQQNAVRAMEG